MLKIIFCCFSKKHKGLSIKDIGYTTEQLLEIIKEDNKIIDIKNNDNYINNDIIDKKIEKDKYGSLEEISLL
jgi:hypothetical protein